jgi:hypothetical protein
MMKKNIGTVDRFIRFVLGLVAFIAIFFVSAVGLKVFLAILGVFSITEALLSRCAVYALLGRNTCPIE